MQDADDDYAADIGLHAAQRLGPAGPVPQGSGTSESGLWSLIRAARIGGLQNIVAALRQALGADSALFDINGNTLAAAPSRTIWNYSLVLEASLGTGTGLQVAAARVFVDNEAVAILAVHDPAPTGRLLEAAVDLVTLEIGRLRARQDGKRELTQHVIEDLVQHRVSEAEGRSRLRSIGFDPESRYRVLLGQANMRRERLLSVPWNIHTLLSNQHEPFVRVVVEGRIFMIVPEDPMVDRIAASLLNHMKEVGNDAAVGVSSVHTGATGIRAGYFEALSAASGGTGVRRPDIVDLGQLLVLTNTTLPLADLAASALKPLADYDSRHGTELVMTLRAFLAANRSFAETAEALFIHRNTLRYRLRQIHDLLGHDVASTRHITNLWLALQVTSVPDEP